MSDSAALRNVLAFLNTADLATDGETLTSPAALATWLADHELVPPGASADPRDLTRAIDVREALRELALANNGVSAVHGPADLGRALGVVRLRPIVDTTGGIGLEPLGGPVQAGLGLLLTVVVGAANDGSWRRVKACREAACRWAFFDGSRNHSRTWCAMNVCGARAKSRAYQQRLRSEQQRAG